jgi:hypothetical protein
MPQVITWEQLKNSTEVPLEGIDRIQVVEQPIDPAFLEIQFETGPAITVWKHVTLMSGEIVDYVSQFWTARLELQDAARGPVQFRVPALDPHEGALMFGRSKRPGEKHLYFLPEFPRAGVRIELKWLTD